MGYLSVSLNRIIRDSWALPENWKNAAIDAKDENFEIVGRIETESVILFDDDMNRAPLEHAVLVVLKCWQGNEAAFFQMSPFGR